MRFINVIIFSAFLFTFSLSIQAKPELSTSYPPGDVEFNVVKVSEHVYFVQGQAGAATENKGFISNTGFVATNMVRSPSECALPSGVNLNSIPPRLNWNSLSMY